jgi:hypothetical protein
LPPDERLIAMREFIWRLDTALLPLFDALEAICTNVLESIDCQQKTILLPDGSKTEPTHTDWSNISTAWCAVAMAVVSAARFRGDRKTFDLWLQRLGFFVDDTPQIGQDLSYERCLWFLGCLDHESLEKELLAWHPAKSDAVWSLRKAGILAEVARDQDAVTLLREAIIDIRRYRRRDVDDIPALSREGWSLWLVLAYRRGFPDRDREFADAPQPLDRWRELAVHNCDARGDYNALLAELEKPDEKPSGIVQERSFDLRRRRTSVQLKSGLPAQLVASYQMLRLVEIVGLPHAANRLSFLKDGLKAAVQRLADAEPWFTSLRTLRLASSPDDSLLNEFFTRSRIALYSVEHAEDLAKVLIRQIDYAFPRCVSDPPLVGYWTGRLAVALEVLSRFALRFSAARAIEMLKRTTAFYRSEVFLRSPRLASPLSSLFARLIEALPPVELASVVSLLFDLPIPSGENFWPEPVTLIPHDFELPPSRNGQRDPVWPAIVDRLIEALGSEFPHRRRPALHRLLRLYRWNHLEQPEIDKFAMALWKRDNLDVFGLPRGYRVEDWAFLSLPESQPGQAARAFREKYLKPDSDSSQPTLALRLQMLGASVDKVEEDSVSFVFDAADISAINGLVTEWTKRPSIHSDDLHPLTLSAEIANERQALEGLRSLLLHVVLPETTYKAVWDKIVSAEIANSPNQTEILGVILFPALARAFPRNVDTLIQRLLRALTSENQEINHQAIFGLYHWLHEQRHAALAVPEPHPDLVREIGIAIAHRRQSILIMALDLARWLIQEGPEEYRSLIVETSLHGLTCLLEEASYSRTRAEEADKIDVPLLRANCVLLALALKQAGYQDQPAVNGWILAAENDPLPEVRNSHVRS